MSTQLMNTYARLPVTFEKGRGATLQDTDGKTYLDALSGIAVCSLGHAHPAISDAICLQSKKLMHTSNLYQIENQSQLAINSVHCQKWNARSLQLRCRSQ